MATHEISQEEFGRLLNKPYELACAFLDCEAFKSWHTPSRDEWCDLLNAKRRMLEKYDWPLYELTSSNDDASTARARNTGLMLNALHKLVGIFQHHDVHSIPSPGQWGDIMRVVDETAERRTIVDGTANSES